jgi:hypothetical protein
MSSTSFSSPFENHPVLGKREILNHKVSLVAFPKEAMISINKIKVS